MEQTVQSILQFLLDWLHTNVLTMTTAAQWVCVGISFVLTALIWRGFERRLYEAIDRRETSDIFRSVLRAVVDVGNVLAFIVLLQICAAVFESLEHVPWVLNAASDLAVAWIIIRLLTSFIPNRFMARVVELTVWIVAALSIFGLLTPITGFLEGISFSIGENSYNALGIIKGLALAAVFLQAASVAAQFAVARIEKTEGLTRSLQVLLAKAIKMLLFTAAILFAMSSVGIDLTSLAIFSSALGVGIGFGLKTIFSNYVAGIILLMDNSIKPGDTIEVSGVYGVVGNMHARYASVLTRSGKEYLIPNELLITGEVVNWTFSDSNVRLEIPVGVAYESDVPKALELMKEAARDVPRVLRNPAPVAWLMGFGDSSVDLELRVWIADAESGVASVRSGVLLNVWNLFHEHGIAIPFPQRDVLLKQDSSLAVHLETPEQTITEGPPENSKE
ncbi:MAG: mechanosensitive ion channel protein MscS [Desulfovibrio sp.]|nr:mechanosensitive ion channel protein MscS [Desulfovibrio sp.]|tara:strand:+ start:1119 stop:2459 length:1341 start_codon:yes stop_codon:yes gene_type:complete